LKHRNIKIKRTALNVIITDGASRSKTYIPINSIIPSTDASIKLSVK